jgi:hypothetical protein
MGYESFFLGDSLMSGLAVNGLIDFFDLATLTYNDSIIVDLLLKSSFYIYV